MLQAAWAVPSAWHGKELLEAITCRANSSSSNKSSAFALRPDLNPPSHPGASSGHGVQGMPLLGCRSSAEQQLAEEHETAHYKELLKPSAPSLALPAEQGSLLVPISWRLGCSVGMAGSWGVS